MNFKKFIIIYIVIWGGFSVGNATLNRFFSLHYLLPFILAALAVVHLLTLHTNGWLQNGPKFLYIRSSLAIFKSTLAFIIPNIKAINRIGPHNLDIISIIVGSLLGDCTAERLYSGGVRFRFRQSIKHKEYLFWLYEFFNCRGYCSNNLPVYYTQKSKSITKLTEAYYFSLYSFTSLLWLYKLFYNHNKNKIIPNNIAEYLTPLALAVWIMDDGTWKKPGVKIATNCFKLEEVILLQKALKLNWNLETSLHKNNNNYQIYIKGTSMPNLKQLIIPYFHISMFYKLGL